MLVVYREHHCGDLDVREGRVLHVVAEEAAQLVEQELLEACVPLGRSIVLGSHESRKKTARSALT